MEATFEGVLNLTIVFGVTKIPLISLINVGFHSINKFQKYTHKTGQNIKTPLKEVK